MKYDFFSLEQVILACDKPSLKIWPLIWCNIFLENQKQSMIEFWSLWNKLCWSNIKSLEFKMETSIKANYLINSNLLIKIEIEYINFKRKSSFFSLLFFHFISCRYCGFRHLIFMLLFFYSKRRRKNMAMAETMSQRQTSFVWIQMRSNSFPSSRFRPPSLRRNTIISTIQTTNKPKASSQKTTISWITRTISIQLSWKLG